MPKKSDVPANLLELLKGDQTGYKLGQVYFAELKHSLMGCFPAVFRETGRIVVTLDPEFLKRVLKTLSPRPLRVRPMKACINREIGTAFLILGEHDHDWKRSKPLQLLTEEKFNELIAKNPRSFDWKPGLLGPRITHEEFLETLQAATE
jgi:hypothetical protein